MKKVEGSKVNSTGLDKDNEDIPRTKPVEPDRDALKSMEAMESSTEDLDDVPELSAEDMQIDFDKIDASTLFDDEFEDDSKISSKMLPQLRKPLETKREERKITEAPSEEALRTKDVFAVPDKVDGKVDSLSGVSYRTKASVVKKKGQSLVLILALAIILIIIIALWITGFLSF
jgi:hypothetical protein